VGVGFGAGAEDAADTVSVVMPDVN
jgi:hypothetical protein